MLWTNIVNLGEKILEPGECKGCTLIGPCPDPVHIKRTGVLVAPFKVPL